MVQEVCSASTSVRQRTANQRRGKSHVPLILLIIIEIFLSDFVINAINTMQQHLIQKGDWRGPLQDVAIRRAGTPGTQLSGSI
jgi:hypothetical protein